MFFVIRILFMSTYVTFVLSLVEMVCVTARLAPSLPKPERPQRQGVRRESVENSLAAAAAKLSNMPVSCRVNTVVLIQFYQQHALHSPLDGSNDGTGGGEKLGISQTV